MDSIQIDSVLRTDPVVGPTFQGVFPADKLPDISYPASIVVNTKGSKHPGEHWVAIHFDKSGSAYYFCSYGLGPMVKKIENYIEKNSVSYKWNTGCLQSPFSSVCGQYAMYFLFLRCCELEPEEIVLPFSEDLCENDRRVKNFVNDYFDLNTAVYDVSHVINQICHALQQ